MMTAYVWAISPYGLDLGFYGMFPLQEVLGGNFVVNENLHNEFAEFKGKVQSYIGTTCCLVYGIELRKVWCRSSETMLKPVHVLGDTYFLMCPYDLDELCQWVRMFFFSDKDFTTDGLLECEKQCSSSISSKVLVINKEEHNDSIKYQPVCNAWQKEKCALLGLALVRGNHSDWTQPSIIAVSRCPLATARIAAADGNCFFQSVSLEFHDELRLLITMYMIHKSTNPMLSSLGSPDDTMESYMKRSSCMSLGIPIAKKSRKPEP